MAIAPIGGMSGMIPLPATPVAAPGAAAGGAGAAGGIGGGAAAAPGFDDLLSPLTATSGPAGPWASQGPGVGEAVKAGLQSVSALEHRADTLIADVATGGPTKVHEVMVATTESAIAVDLLVQVRDRALEAYHEVMRLQL